MKKASVVLLFAIWLGILSSGAWGDANWPAWRGADGSGIAHYSNPPVSWSESENVLWKKSIPGRGNSTPIIWDGRIYLTTAISSEGSVGVESGFGWRQGIVPSGKLDYAVLALDASTGEVIWQRTAITDTPHEGTHRDGTWASNSPVTDGEHLIAFFGSRGIFCFDLNGKELWSKDLGNQQTRLAFGEGSSPALYGKNLVVNWDHEGASFLVVLDKRTGSERWRRERDEGTSWSTPLVRDFSSRPQVIVAATNHSRGYDLNTGEEIWVSSGMTFNVIPSPVYANGLVYLASGFRGAALQAIDPEKARGDLTESEAVVWRYGQDTPYVPSTLVYEDRIYFLKGNRGILSCLDARTGEPVYTRQRLEGISEVYASPVAANGCVYLTGRGGTTLVIKSGDEYKVLSRNSLDDYVDASIALSGGRLYIRGRNSLYCISEEKMSE
jgi:outer membrane protein assembly factor BamB